jgi:hypothetical protein
VSAAWRTVGTDELVTRCAGWIADGPGTVLVAVDGPRLHDHTRDRDHGSDAEVFAERLVEPLRALGRGAVHVRAVLFWRDASLRLEHGREDWESYLDWLDADALRREVLDAAVQRQTYVPSLRDPMTDRSTREPVRPVPAAAVIIVSGEFLLGRGLPWNRVIHLETSPAGRERTVDEQLRWILPAYDRYEETVGPAEQADVVVKTTRVITVRGLP